MKVEGIVHPTTAEIDLKEEIGEAVLRADKAVLKLAFWIVVLYDHLRNDFRKVLGFVCYEEWDYYSSQAKCPYWFFFKPVISKLCHKHQLLLLEENIAVCAQWFYF